MVEEQKKYMRVYVWTVWHSLTDYTLVLVQKLFMTITACRYHGDCEYMDNVQFGKCNNCMETGKLHRANMLHYEGVLNSPSTNDPEITFLPPYPSDHFWTKNSPPTVCQNFKVILEVKVQM